MNIGDLWLKSLDLGSIATSLMVIAVTLLIIASKISGKSHKKSK